MRELQRQRQARSGSRVRSVQGRLSIQSGEEKTAGGEAGPDRLAKSTGFRRPAKRQASAANHDGRAAAKSTIPVFHPLAYRSVVAAWPIEWREQWGRRANELEETGLAWRDAEVQAFAETWHQFRRMSGREPLSSLTAIADADQSIDPQV